MLGFNNRFIEHHTARSNSNSGRREYQPVANSGFAIRKHAVSNNMNMSAFFWSIWRFRNDIYFGRTKWMGLREYLSSGKMMETTLPQGKKKSSAGQMPAVYWDQSRKFPSWGSALPEETARWLEAGTPEGLVAAILLWALLAYLFDFVLHLWLVLFLHITGCGCTI